MKVWKVRY